MRRRTTSCVAIAFVACVLTSAQALTEAPPKLKEPWAGWWWPGYHATFGHCDYCPHHLWTGGYFGGEPGPIYNHDTRYFWLPEPERTQAQAWEFDPVNRHHTDDSTEDYCGHCNGVSCAQVLEPQPPSDCGALSQDDLEGLLGEIYMDCGLSPRTGICPTPSDMWLTLRACLRDGDMQGGGLKVMVIDFSTTQEWYWPVYGYRIDYEMINDTTADGKMTMYYEDHVYGVINSPASAWYRFTCYMQDGDDPDPTTGVWGECHGPHNLDCPPYRAYVPTTICPDPSTRNPYVCGKAVKGFDRLKRVIDHKTIIMDDAYMTGAEPCNPPGDSWVRRPGYSDSCWATQDSGRWTYYRMWWYPRLACDGLWGFSVYKTPPASGDTLDDSVEVGISPLQTWTFDQSVPPFDVWQLLGCDSLTQKDAKIFVLHSELGDSYPRRYFTYFDALKLEYLEEGGGGGPSSSTVSLGDDVQRVRVTPSPAGRTARISYTVPYRGNVDIAVYDVTGRAVLRAAQGTQRAGVQTAAVSVAGLPTGTYMARVSVNGVNTTCRFVVCR